MTSTDPRGEARHANALSQLRARTRRPAPTSSSSLQPLPTPQRGAAAVPVAHYRR
ncbi:hypothetical protein HBB16_06365 [Pseudonocardia sp. MCCB 268]|nr:hypothetical protein [Pseudonocardia cytotoxica]